VLEGFAMRIGVPRTDTGTTLVPRNGAVTSDLRRLRAFCEERRNTMPLARLIGIAVCSILISSAALAAEPTSSGVSSRGQTETRSHRNRQAKSASGAESGEKPATKSDTALHGKDANGGFRSSSAGDGTSGMANPAPVPGAAE
jgi:hypothetical protein